MNPGDNEQKLHSPKTHKDHVAGKRFTSMSHCNLLHKFISMPQAMKISDAKAAVDKEWKKLETSPAMEMCHLENAGLEPKLQKNKGRVVLRGDIVKDDSGACAVFTEQASSASQMTAAKIMNVIARLPGCDGQAADAVSAFSQVKL